MVSFIVNLHVHHNPDQLALVEACTSMSVLVVLHLGHWQIETTTLVLAYYQRYVNEWLHCPCYPKQSVKVSLQY